MTCKTHDKPKNPEEKYSKDLLNVTTEEELVSLSTKASSLIKGAGGDNLEMWRPEPDD